MPTPTYTALATRTLTSTATSVTFSSIPATYRDLILVVNRFSTTNANMICRINNDSGANYAYVTMWGNGTTTGSGANSANTSLVLEAESFSSTTTAVLTIAQFLDYASTDKHKTVLARANNSSRSSEAIASRWANTSAINTISFTSSAGSFAIDSTFSLYGVIA